MTVEIRTAPIQIAASPEEVFAVLADTSTWAGWAAGAQLKASNVALGAPCAILLPLLPGPRPPLPAKFTLVDPARGLGWAGGVPGLITGEHRFELTRVAGGTSVAHGELFHGLGAPVLGVVREQFRSLYERMNAGLRDYVEARSLVG